MLQNHSTTVILVSNNTFAPAKPTFREILYFIRNQSLMIQLKMPNIPNSRRCFHQLTMNHKIRLQKRLKNGRLLAQNNT